MKRVVFVSFFFIFAGIAMAHIPVKEPFSKKMESRIREVAKMLPEKPRDLVLLTMIEMLGNISQKDMMLS